jgi:N-acetylneuraminic acid mutarotase
MISRLTWTGSSWQKVDLVRGLPRSEENHAANGMQLDATTNTLYVAMGGNTNQGAPSNNFALLPEFALSAAILSVDLDAIGNTTYDLPTLNDENRSGNPDANDPFGGNDGKNQAKLVPGGPVQVYAPGFRNPYDVVITQSGQMYTIDNGGNAGWGDVPINEGPSGSCTNGVNEPGTSDQDALHLITGSGYYGGHPNPTRANTANTFNTSIPQSPVSSGNAIECDYRKVGTAESTALTSFLSSTNGIDEYTATNFGGQMQGDLLAAGYVKNEIYRVQLNAAGTAVTSNSVLFTTVGSGPLDVVAQGNQGPFPGTIWVADQKNGNIYAFEPNDFGGSVPTCTGADDPTLDEDADHYSNADEIDNGTDPCSAADVPPDWDGDHVSNLNDPDDDNDGAPDTSDPFAIDPHNGTTTSLPVQYTWENNAPNPGGILNLGFTGLMTNGASNYEALYDENKMTGGGAAGVLTVDQVSEGDALGSLNTQEYGFQFGVDADPATTNTFTVHTRIMGPFNGLTPQDFQSMGLFIGTGSQNHYAKIVTAANGGGGGIQFLKEVNGTAGSARQAAVSLPGPDWVDLYLTVDPDAATVQPQYSVTTSGSTGAIVNLGGPEPIPSSWFTNASSGLAVGILSTSRGTAPVFPATWDLIEVVPQDIGDPNVLAHDTFTRTTSGGWGSAEIGGSWGVVAGSAGNFSVNGQKGLIATPGGNVQQMVHLPAVSVRDADATVSITFPDAPSGSGTFFGYGVLRRQSGGAYYRVGLFVTSGGKVFIRGQTSSGVALFPDVDTGLSFTAGDTFALRVQAVGASPTTIRAKAWEQGTAEPTGWNVTTTNSASGLQQAGSVGLRTVTTGTSAATTLRIDDFLVQLAGGVLPPPTSTGEWQSRAPSGPNRQEVSYVQTGGKLYLAGGSNSSGNLTAHEVYDPATNTWSTVAPLPEGLDHIQAVVVGGKIYYVGGLEAWPGPASAQVYIYDPATNAFTQGAAMPRPRGAGGVAVHQGKIYYAGGLSAGVAVPWFDVYDPATNTWTQLPNMPQARDHFHAHVVNGKFWVTGGRNTNINSTITSTHAYDLSTGTWQTGFAPIPTARGGFGAAVLGSEILVIGGEGGGNTFNIVEAYDTTTNTWRTLAPMPTARHGIQAAVCNDGVYVAAGGTIQGGSGPTDVHQVFFLNGATTCTSTSPSPSPSPSPPPTGLIAQDTFTRTVTNSWGTADVGGPWTVIAGAAANFDVDGARGTVATPGGSQQQAAHLGQVSVRDVDLRVALTFPDAPTASGNFFGYLLLRRQAGGSNYRVGLYVTPGGKVFIRGQTSAGANVFPDVDTGLSFAAGDTFWLRVQAEGASPTTIRARAWEQGTVEPASWQATATDSTAGLQQVGSVGIRTVNLSTTATTLRLDDLAAMSI